MASSPARQRILDTAFRLFYARGLRAVGVDLLIAESGVAKATFYKYFPGKDDLVLAYLDRVDEVWTGQLQAAAAAGGDRPADQLVGLFDALGTACRREGYRGCAFLNAAAESAPGTPCTSGPWPTSGRCARGCATWPRRRGRRDPEALARVADPAPRRRPRQSARSTPIRWWPTRHGRVPGSWWQRAPVDTSRDRRPRPRRSAGQGGGVVGVTAPTPYSRYVRRDERDRALHETVDIEAPPERVWSLVTDLPRMASWSPQVVTDVRARPGGRGTRALNINRRGPLLWPTRSKVVAFEPHREFAFQIRDNAAIWAFVLGRTARYPAGARAARRRTASCRSR